MKIENLNLPFPVVFFEGGVRKSKIELTPKPVPAFTVVREGLWVHKTCLSLGGEVIPRGSWTITVGPLKAVLIGYIPSREVAIHMGKVLSMFPGVDWTKVESPSQLPSDLVEVLLVLRTAIWDKGILTKGVVRLEELLKEKLGEAFPKEMV